MADWFDEIKDKLAAVAPTILGALGGTLGTILAPGAGTAAGATVGKLAGDVLAKIFGISDASNQKAVIDAIKADPNALLKLKEAELALQLELKKLENEKLKIELDETKAFLGDVQDARKREIEIVKAGGSNYSFYAIGWIITLSFFGILAMLIFRSGEIPSGARDIVNMMLGYLASNFTTVVSYFYGSSKGSADKQSWIGKIEDKFLKGQSTGNGK